MRPLRPQRHRTPTQNLIRGQQLPHLNHHPHKQSRNRIHQQLRPTPTSDQRILGDPPPTQQLLIAGDINIHHGNWYSAGAIHYSNHLRRCSTSAEFPIDWTNTNGMSRLSAPKPLDPFPQQRKHPLHPRHDFRVRDPSSHSSTVGPVPQKAEETQPMA